MDHCLALLLNALSFLLVPAVRAFPANKSRFEPYFERSESLRGPEFTSHRGRLSFGVAQVLGVIDFVCFDLMYCVSISPGFLPLGYPVLEIVNARHEECSSRSILVRVIDEIVFVGDALRRDFSFLSTSNGILAVFFFSFFS